MFEEGVVCNVTGCVHDDGYSFNWSPILDFAVCGTPVENHESMYNIIIL